MARTYGQITLDSGSWRIKAEPHVMMKLKAIFGKVARFDLGDGVMLSNTPENAYDLLWFLQHYPLDVPDLQVLKDGAAAHRESVRRCEALLAGDYTPRIFTLAKPARDYQARAAEILLERKGLIIGDDLGLGKSMISIAAMTDPRALPALVVTLPNLPRQWERYVHEFAPDLTTHILKKAHPYELPRINGRTPDVLICNYHKLAGWANVLSRYVRFVTFDENQELRRTESLKYQAATKIAQACTFRCGLSATPVMNYGGEFWNVSEVICPGALGNRDEFLREWCVDHGAQHRLKDPRAFGSHLRESFIMLRRTRKEVGRELPPVIRICHTIDSDTRELHKIKDTAGELARIILGNIASTREQRFTAGGQFDMLVRQATGIAKAPFVADFVRMIVDSGEPVILAGWHRSVYDIWESRLKDLHPVYYTGTESTAAKERSVEAFLSGRSKVMLMSLRAGVGLEGLQQVCSTVVFGELDWSPGIHDQCLSDDTEVLTLAGFKAVDDVSVGDWVSGFDPSTSKMRWVRVLNKTDRRLAPGERLYGTRTEKIDLCVTGGHRMLVRRKVRSTEGVGRSAWYFDEAGNLSGRSRRFVPVCGTEDAQGVPLTEHELRFVGWFLTDGYLHRGNVVIYQAANQPWNSDIVEVLDGCGMKWACYQRRNSSGGLLNMYVVPKGALHRWSRDEIDTLFSMHSSGASWSEIGRGIGRSPVAVRKKYKKLSNGDCWEPVAKRTERGWSPLSAYLDKNLSPLLEAVTRDQLGHLLHGINMGDGAKGPRLKNVMRITNTNKAFLDRLQSLCVRRGFSANISERKSRTKRGKAVYDIYVAEATEACLPRGDKPNAFTVVGSYRSDRVWCVTNELGTLVVRRNGKVAIVGNCIGRLHRDGIEGNVVAYYLISEDGADPIMADVLGIKREQVAGIKDPDAPLIERLEKGENNIRRLAEAFIGKKR